MIDTVFPFVFSVFNLYPLSDNYVLHTNRLDCVLHEVSSTSAPSHCLRVCHRILWMIWFASLVTHSAFNVTTLKVLKNCELPSLSLAPRDVVASRMTGWSCTTLQVSTSVHQHQLLMKKIDDMITIRPLRSRTTNKMLSWEQL
jgi:hypothetical protein